VTFHICAEDGSRFLVYNTTAWNWVEVSSATYVLNGSKSENAYFYVGVPVNSTYEGMKKFNISWSGIAGTGATTVNVTSFWHYNYSIPRVPEWPQEHYNVTLRVDNNYSRPAYLVVRYLNSSKGDANASANVARWIPANSSFSTMVPIEGYTPSNTIFIGVGIDIDGNNVVDVWENRTVELSSKLYGLLPGSNYTCVLEIQKTPEVRWQKIAIQNNMSAGFGAKDVAINITVVNASNGSVVETVFSKDSLIDGRNAVLKVGDPDGLLLPSSAYIEGNLLRYSIWRDLDGDKVKDPNEFWNVTYKLTGMDENTYAGLLIEDSGNIDTSLMPMTWTRFTSYPGPN